MVNENLAQYVLEAREGKEEALAKLYSRTLVNSYYLCRKLTADNTAATELFAKSYADAFCNLDKLKRPESFEAWLKQKIASVYRDGESFIFGDADGDSPALSSEFLPASVLEDKALCDAIEERIALLPKEQRTVTVLYYCIGMPVDFIAKFLSISISSVNSLLAKSRKAICEVLPHPPEVLSEDSLPVLTRIFQRSAVNTKVSNEVVRDTFIYAVDVLEGKEAAAPAYVPAPEEKAEPVQPAVPAQTIPVIDETSAGESEEPKTIIIEDGTKPSESVTVSADSTGAELIREIESAVTSFSTDNGYEPPKAEITYQEAPEGVSLDDYNSGRSESAEPEKAKAKDKGKMKLFIIIAAILVAVVAIVGIVAAVKKHGGSQPEPVSLSEGETDTQSVPVEFVPGLFEEYDQIAYFNEYCCVVRDAETGKFGLMNYQGEIVLACEYAEFLRCSYGRDYSQRSSYHYLVRYETGSRDLYEVNMNDFSIKSAVHVSHSVDDTDVLDDKKYSERDRYFNGYAAVRDADTGKWGYISEESGKLVIECLYEAVNVFDDTYEYGKCDYCRAVENGMVAVKRANKMGVIDMNGTEVVPFEYDEILQGDKGVYIAQKDGEWGVILVGDAVETYDTGSTRAHVASNLSKILETADELSGTYLITQDVNVRSEASSDGGDTTVLGELAEGETVTVVATYTDNNGKEWICFQYENGYAWAIGRYLEKVSD